MTLDEVYDRLMQELPHTEWMVSIVLDSPTEIVLQVASPAWQTEQTISRSPDDSELQTAIEALRNSVRRLSTEDRS